METVKPKVLVVDDDQLVADTLAMILNISGFTATAAYSGARAVELAGDSAFDHVITDVMMDGMNGIEASLAIRELLSDCRALLISGNTNTSSLLVAASAQGHEFEILAKPVHPSVVLQYLRGTELPNQNTIDTHDLD